MKVIFKVNFLFKFFVSVVSWRKGYANCSMSVNIDIFV